MLGRVKQGPRRPPLCSSDPHRLRANVPTNGCTAWSSACRRWWPWVNTEERPQAPAHLAA